MGEKAVKRVTVSFDNGCSVTFEAEFWRTSESLINEAIDHLGPLALMVDKNKATVEQNHG